MESGEGVPGMGRELSETWRWVRKHGIELRRQEEPSVGGMSGNFIS